MALSSSQRAKAQKTLAKAKKQLQGIKKTKDSISAKGGFTKSGLSQATSSLKSINRKASGISRNITSDALQSREPLNLPEAPEAEDLSPLTNGINSTLASAMGGFYDPQKGFVPPTTTEATTQTQPNSATELFNTYLQSNEQAKADMPSQEAMTREMQKELKPKEDLVNSLQNQITQITNTRDAKQLSLEGQGRGITDVIIGGQQAKIGREAAIQALPLQSQLAAAQGDLESARSYLGQLYTARTQDAQNEYNYRTALNASVYGFLNAQEQRQIDAKNKELDRSYSEQQNNIAFQRQLGLQALEFGQNSLISGISSVDPSSPTFEQDIAAFTSQLRKPVAAPTATSVSAPTIKTINGVDMQWDPTTGTWINPTTGENATPRDLRLIDTSRQIDIIDEIANSNAIDSVVGTTIFGRAAGSTGGVIGRFLAGATAGGAVGAAAGAPFAGVGAIPGAIGGALIGGTLAAGQGVKDKVTGDRQQLLANISQLTAKLTNQELIGAKARGATYGALGVKEQQLLEQAATNLNAWALRQGNDPEGALTGINAAPASVLKELDTIRYYTVLDYALTGGDPTEKGAVLMDDGTYWVKNYDGSLSQLQ